jgi:hypothetical protein
MLHMPLKEAVANSRVRSLYNVRHFLSLNRALIEL